MSFTTEKNEIEVEKGSSSGIWLEDSEGNLQFIGGNQLKGLIEEEN